MEKIFIVFIVIIFIVFKKLSSQNSEKNEKSIKTFPDNEKGTFKYQEFSGTTLIEEKFFINGIISYSKSFFYDGTLESETTYFDNGVLKNCNNFIGKNELIESWVSESESNFTKCFYENNKLTKKEIYKDDKLSSYETFYESGALKSKATYNNDSLGIQINYSENGEIIDEFEVFEKFQIKKLDNGRISFISFKEDDDLDDNYTKIVERDLENGIYKFITAKYYDEVELKNGEFHGIYKRHHFNKNKEVISAEELYKFENGKFVEIYKLEELNHIFNSDNFYSDVKKNKDVEDQNIFTFDPESSILTFKKYKTENSKKYLENIYYLKASIFKLGYYLATSFDFVNSDKFFYPNGNLKEIWTYNDDGILLSHKKYDEYGKITNEIIMTDTESQIGKYISYLPNGGKSITYFDYNLFSDLTLVYNGNNTLIEQIYEE